MVKETQKTERMWVKTRATKLCISYGRGKRDAVHAQWTIT